jgi:hypothetical protein
MSAVPASIWQGTFTLFGVEVKCHVLSDGQRIIEAESLRKVLEAMYSGAELNQAEVVRFGRWQRGNA